MQKSDEWMLNHQNFPTKILHLQIFGGLFIIIFKYSSEVCHIMSGHRILKYFCPILDKKVSTEDKELYSIRLGYY